MNKRIFVVVCILISINVACVGKQKKQLTLPNGITYVNEPIKYLEKKHNIVFNQYEGFSILPTDSLLGKAIISNEKIKKKVGADILNANQIDELKLEKPTEIRFGNINAQIISEKVLLEYLSDKYPNYKLVRLSNTSWAYLNKEEETVIKVNYETVSVPCYVITIYFKSD